MAASDSSFQLQQAVELHQRGAVADARQRYADILRREPGNIDALYLLGLAHCHLGEFADAIKRLRKAVSLAPAHAAAHNALSMALRETGRHEEALASSERAIAADPGSVEAHANRGDILQDLRRPQDALAAYDRALALNPDFLPAWINRGSVLQEFERHDEAIASYDRATALAPDIAEAWLNRSRSLRALGRIDEALASCDRAITIRPDLALGFLARGLLLRERGQWDAAVASLERAEALLPAWPEAPIELANTLRMQGDTDSALRRCEQALALDPDHFASWHLHGRLLYETGKLDAALASVERALALKPDLAECHGGRGAILIKQNRAAEAVVALDRAISIAPHQGTYHVDRGLALNALGRFDESSAALDRGRALVPDDPHVQFVIGLTDLLHGRWTEGFAGYEGRLAVPFLNTLHRRFLGRDIDTRFERADGQALQNFPRWTGGPPSGDAILIETEQGLGDCIQYAGFAAHLARLGHRVQILTLPILAPLLRSVPGVETVIDDQAALEALDVKHWLPLMSVPHLLDVTPDKIPFDVPFLSAEPERAARWANRLGSSGFKVGIAWQGNPQNWLDAGRSIPLQAFAALAEIPGVRLFSLQKRPGAEQIEEVGFRDRIERPLDDADKSPQALLDTAAVLAHLDLVVTSDSMLAHLAGALGRPTFVALRRIPDWRWLLKRDDSPWYPTARLFRQEQEGDWAAVFERIADAVRPLVEAAGAR